MMNIITTATSFRNKKTNTILISVPTVNRDTNCSNEDGATYRAVNCF